MLRTPGRRLSANMFLHDLRTEEFHYVHALMILHYQANRDQGC